MATGDVNQGDKSVFGMPVSSTFLALCPCHHIQVFATPSIRMHHQSDLDIHLHRKMLRIDGLCSTGRWLMGAIDQDLRG
jgi:hypothetical protein